MLQISILQPPNSTWARRKEADDWDEMNISYSHLCSSNAGFGRWIKVAVLRTWQMILGSAYSSSNWRL